MNINRKSILLILILSLGLTALITFKFYSFGFNQKGVLKENNSREIIAENKSSFNNLLNSFDYHLIYEVKRSYFGSISKLSDIKIWASKDKIFVAKGSVVTLYLLKEKKRLVFSKDKKRYVELPLHINKEHSSSSIHKARGYKPIYYWQDIKILGDSIIENKKYQKITSKGIAKYSEIDMEGLVFKPLKAGSNFYPNLIFLDDSNLNLLMNNEILESSIFYQLKQTIIPPNPVPENYWIEFKLIKFETKKVSEDLFRIPATAIKVNTIEEL